MESARVSRIIESVDTTQIPNVVSVIAGDAQQGEVSYTCHSAKVVAGERWAYITPVLSTLDDWAWWVVSYEGKHRTKTRDLREAVEGAWAHVLADPETDDAIVVTHQSAMALRHAAESAAAVMIELRAVEQEELPTAERQVIASCCRDDAFRSALVAVNLSRLVPELNEMLRNEVYRYIGNVCSDATSILDRTVTSQQVEHIPVLIYDPRDDSEQVVEGFYRNGKMWAFKPVDEGWSGRRVTDFDIDYRGQGAICIVLDDIDR